MYKLCIFAGTTEGRELVELLAGQPVAVTACVATEYGETLLTPRENLTVSAKRMTGPEMEAFFRREKFDCVVDATHPYAAVVTENIAGAAAAAQVEYLRLLRGGSAAPVDAVFVEDTAAAVEFLESTEGDILLTTGSKELGRYAALPDFARRVYARVLPMQASLEACERAGLAPSHILAMQGPFSKEMNLAMLRMTGAAWLVTKEGGSTGGFQEKADAARETGTSLLVVGRPPQRDGLDFNAMAELLCKKFGLTLRPQVTLVGIGPGNRGGMTAEVRRAIREADCLMGAKRMLEAADPAPNQKTVAAVAPETIAAAIRENRDCRRFTVVLSGDAGFFSGAKKLLPLLSDCRVEVLPGLSSLAVLCARVKTSWEDVYCLSCHGRDTDPVVDVATRRRVFALVGGEDGMAGLCRTLTEVGLGHVRVSVGERLGYPDERITVGTAAELGSKRFDSLSAALIENDRAVPFVPGLPDEAFQRGKGTDGAVVPMTKREVRALALSSLRLTEDAVCWDVGAGTGSVSVEMALRARRGTVYAIEKKEGALSLLRENKQRFHVRNVEIVPGSAPEACRELPAPTHAFIGGSSGSMRELLALLLEKNPSVRIVAAAVSLETAAELTAAIKEFDFAEHEVVCLSAARGREVGGYHLMTAQNPVYLFTLQRRTP